LRARVATKVMANVTEEEEYYDEEYDDEEESAVNPGNVTQKMMVAMEDWI